MTNEAHNTNPKTAKPRRWFRFRLRTLLILVTLLSVSLGWIGWELDQRQRERKVVAWVEEMRGEVSFRFGNGVSFHSVFILDERNWWQETKDEWFRGGVHVVKLNSTQVSDLSPLAALKNLQFLDLSRTKLSDLSSLSKLKTLKGIDLSFTQVSDLSALAELKSLEKLALHFTPVSDLSPLAGLKNLRQLSLQETNVSKEQVQELQKALPNCEISF